MFYEAGLAHGYVGRGSVAEEGNVEAHLLFLVTLGEVLLKQEICPLLGHIKVSQRGTYVT